VVVLRKKYLRSIGPHNQPEAIALTRILLEGLKRGRKRKKKVGKDGATHLGFIDLRAREGKAVRGQIRLLQYSVAAKPYSEYAKPYRGRIEVSAKPG
jgi:hypothetical protein